VRLFDRELEWVEAFSLPHRLTAGFQTRRVEGVPSPPDLNDERIDSSLLGRDNHFADRRGARHRIAYDPERPDLIELALRR